MNPDEHQEIQNLFQGKMPIRAIARRLGRDPKTIRRALDRPPASTQPPKLEPFHDLIAQLASQDLTAPRILRELQKHGYTGGLTILKQHLQRLRGPSKPPRPVFRRFETRPAEEGQVDWSPYRLRIGTEEMVLHCFSLILRAGSPDAPVAPLASTGQRRGAGFAHCAGEPLPRVLSPGRGLPGGPEAAHECVGPAFRRTERPDLLILEDCGFDTTLGREAANELFRVVCARYRQRSTVVVTNLPFRQWGEFLPSSAQAVAIIDRLIDQATILRFSGKPFRQPRDIHGAPLDGE